LLESEKLERGGEEKMKCWNCGDNCMNTTPVFYGVCNACYALGYREEKEKKEVDAFQLGKKVGKIEVKERE
jgi:hypothetical protein